MQPGVLHLDGVAAGSAAGAGGASGVATAEAVGTPDALLPCLYYNNCTGGFPSRLKKSAFSLAENVRWLCERKGIERVGFMTLTFVDNVQCNKEAARRFHSFATHYLRPNFGDYIAAIERQVRGALHYHLVVECQGDIRTGCDFEAIEAGDYRTAGAYLRELWGALRGACKRYNFGRSELMPIKSTAEGVGRYVGKYIRMDWQVRTWRDRGQRKIRYGMEVRPFSARFQWFTDNSALWREGCRRLCALLGSDDFKGLLGTKWAWFWRREIATLCVFTKEEVAEFVALLHRHPLNQRPLKLLHALTKTDLKWGGSLESELDRVKEQMHIDKQLSVTY